MRTNRLAGVVLCAAMATTGSAGAQSRADTSAAHDAHAAHAWEVSLAFGRDFESKENLWAVALGRRFGEGWKGVFEFADGKHGEHGSYVTSLKAMKELGRWDAWALGLGAGGAYVREEHHSGWGLLVAAELAYAIDARWGLKLEASYLWGLGEIDSVRAPALQAGVVFKF
jgi:hypothetical protein